VVLGLVDTIDKFVLTERNLRRPYTVRITYTEGSATLSGFEFKHAEYECLWIVCERHRET
jgi:hypothetical protein